MAIYNQATRCPRLKWRPPAKRDKYSITMSPCRFDLVSAGDVASVLFVLPLKLCWKGSEEYLWAHVVKILVYEHKL